MEPRKGIIHAERFTKERAWRCAPTLAATSLKSRPARSSLSAGAGLTPEEREFIKKTDGRRVPPGLEVSHEEPLYTVPSEERGALDSREHEDAGQG